MPEYERITADDIGIGDRVARAKTHEFEEVTEIVEGPVARRLIGGRLPDRWSNDTRRTIARPRRTAKWWREVRA